MAISGSTVEFNQCCEILGISPTASYAEAKSAYRTLAKMYHPDKHRHDEHLAFRASEKFKQLLNAWEEFEQSYEFEEQKRKDQEALQEQQRRQREQLKREEAARIKAESIRLAEEAREKALEDERRKQRARAEGERLHAQYLREKEEKEALDKVNERKKKRAKNRFFLWAFISIAMYLSSFFVIGGWAIWLFAFTWPFVLGFIITWNIGFDGWRTD